MGKKSSPKAPDYTKVAEKQAQQENEMNTQNIWANRVNQSDPYGRSTFTAKKGVDPVTGKPITQWSQQTTLNPQLQAALNAQFGLTADRSKLADQLFGQYSRQMSQPLDYSKFTSYGATPKAGNLQAITNPNSYASLISGAGQGIQSGLNFKGLQSVDDAAATRQRAEDAIYKSASSRLDPQWQQRQHDLESQLANRGIFSGSEAYTKALDDFNRQRTDAYNQAQMSSITGGGAEAERDYGMDLGLRQQQAQERMSQGEFANSAQAQRWAQLMGAGQFGLGAQQQAFGQRQQAGEQNFDQQLAGSQYQNQVRQQQIAEAMQKRGYGLQEINALLSGAQVGGPNFANYSQAGMGSTPDYLNAANMGYQGQLDQANAAQAGRGQTMQTVGTIASAAAMFF